MRVRHHITVLQIGVPVNLFIVHATATQHYMYSICDLQYTSSAKNTSRFVIKNKLDENPVNTLRETRAPGV